jgi:hypothetical protein
MKALASAVAVLVLLLAAGCGSAPLTSSRPANAAGAARTEGHSGETARLADPPADHPIFAARATNSLSVDPDFPKFREYLEELIRSVDEEWNRILATSAVYPRPGSEVSVRFTLNSDGIVTQIVEIEATAGKQAEYACLRAIQNPQPYRPWTQEMIDALGSEETLTFRFFYK